jgi:hypothetical protein
MTTHRLLSRIQAVENRLNPDTRADLHVHIMKNTEHAKHPELYEIESTDTRVPTEPGAMAVYIHRFKRKNHDQTNDAGPY